MCASLGLRWPLPCSNLCLIGLGWAGGGEERRGKALLLISWGWGLCAPSISNQ